jgi:drug/metabolite transporter (DMT)-like permease
MAAISVTLIPVFGIAFSALSLREAVTFKTLAAAAVVLVGLALLVERSPHPTERPVTSPTVPPCHPCPSL